MSTPTKQTSRTLAGVREALFEQLDTLRSGGDIKRALAVAAVSKEIVSAAVLQLNFEKAHAGKKIGAKLQNITLGEEILAIGADKR